MLNLDSDDVKGCRHTRPLCLGWRGIFTEKFILKMSEREVRRLAKQAATKQKIRIRLKAYDHRILDQSAMKIVETAKRTGASVFRLIPLPTERSVYTILRAVHKYKDSREQFEMRVHKRLIDSN